jgi:hypothetical protein
MDKIITFISLILLIAFMGFLPFLVAKDLLTGDGKNSSTGKTILAGIIVLALMLFMFSGTPGWNRLFN